MLKYFLRALPLLLFFISNISTAQLAFNYASTKRKPYSFSTSSENALPLFERKLYQRNTGAIIGLQKGNSTSIELGYEAHWRKISLRKPHVIGATTNLEYNFGDNVIGYKAGMWMKRGRVNLTYGANVSYFTNFNEGNRFGIGPSVGFRFAGLHLINGYNFLTKDKTGDKETPMEVNSLYMSLRYYFPVTNTFTWDRKTKKKIKERKKARAKKQKEREKKKESAEHKGILDVFKTKPNTEVKKKEPEEKKGLQNLFNKLKPKPKD
ncbi:MAG TPA: hypothetical protein VF622_01690 [Segetibacter sp.]|jgi:hypothetical protein